MKFKQINMKRILAVCSFLIIAGASLLMLQAEEDVVPTIYSDQYDIATYRGETVSVPEMRGYVFAGWYKEDQTKESGYAPLNVTEADDATSAIAKFVDEDVLGVKCQLRVKTKSTSPTTSLRMVTTVDTLDYSQVGFNVTLKGSTANCVSNSVYTTINGYEDNNKVSYTPTVFSSSSNYFMAYTITELPNQYFTETISITPTWTTLDGTVVTSTTMARDIKIQEQIVDFYDGLTFDYNKQVEAFSKQDDAAGHQIDFARVQYADEGLSTVDGLGTYGIKGIVGTSAKWPGFYVNYGEEIPAGTGLSFMAYVKADSTTATYSMGLLGSTGAMCSFDFPLNEWFEVRVIATTQTEKQGLYFDFNGNDWTTSLLESGASIYMDNFQLIADAQQTVDEATGNMTIHTDWFKPAMAANYCDVDYIWNVSLKQGDTITFTVDENGASGSGAFWAYFPINGVYTEKAAASWTQTNMKTMTYTVTEDTETIKIKSRYNGGVSAMKDFLIKNITISGMHNFYTGIDFNYSNYADVITAQTTANNKIDFTRIQYDAEDVSTIEGLGTWGLKGVVGSTVKWPGFYLDFGTEIPAGTGISFMMYVKVDSPSVTYTMGGKNTSTNKDNVTKRNITRPVNEWFEVRMITNDAVSKEQIYFDFSTVISNGLFTSGATIYMDNFKLITSPTGTIDESTGTITVHTDWQEQGVNGSDYDVNYIWNQSLAQGKKLSFTFDEGDASANGQNGAVFFYVWDSTNSKYVQADAKTWVQGKSFTYEATSSVEKIKILVKYYDSDGSNVSDYTITYTIE